MTSRLALLFAAFFLALPQGAAADSGPKPPKTLCLDWGVSIMMLAIRPAGARLETEEGPVKLYEVYGELVVQPTNDAVPLAGSGHMAGSELHFAAAGGHYYSGEEAFFSQHWEARWDVVSQTGTGYTQSQSTKYGTLEAIVELEAVPCDVYDGPAY